MTIPVVAVTPSRPLCNEHTTAIAAEMHPSALPMTAFEHTTTRHADLLWPSEARLTLAPLTSQPCLE